MKGRRTKNRQNRKNFKAEDLLERKNNSQNDASARSKYLTVTFLGFHDSKGNIHNFI